VADAGPESGAAARARACAREPPKDAVKPAAQAEAPPPPPPPKPAGPRPIRSIKPLVPHKPKAPPPDEGLPWGWIGAAIGVLALGGAGVVAVIRRRKAPPVGDKAAEPTLE
jgi:hypothetical protein